MDQILLNNIEHYQKLVARFKPPVSKADEAEAREDADFVIAARIRPMLDDEAASGLVPGVFLRGAQSQGTIDLHELRRKVRGPPVINVRLRLHLTNLHFASVRYS